MIKKVLIANRGEIAIRVMRTAREMGIRTVAVFSEADADSPFVRLADEAVAIGGSEPNQSYLRVQAILDAAKQTGSDAIHPGYGFLSERDTFADACLDAGICFLGPSGETMRRLGAKIAAKQLAEDCGVPIAPGYFKPDATDADLRQAAQEIGFPVMLKASAGGGGRGMRVVRELGEFDSALALARDEAINGFGDGAMMVEKFVPTPRHIEVQVACDQHGNVAALFERECSVQRRHQKLIEEAPSPYVRDHPELWDRLRDAAVKLCRGAGYVGLGTIEFMVDPLDGAHYFLEVNARLQVEHPVTEQITGLDLVRLQFEIAQGANLSDLIPEFLKGDRSLIRAHSIEVRVVSENPAAGFMPSIGPILGWAEPKMPGVRVDTGYGPETEVSRFYDSLLAKVIVTARDRSQAIAKMHAAIEDFHILGVQTNLEYIQDVMRHPEFVAGNIDTAFLGRAFEGWTPRADFPAAASSALMQVETQAKRTSGKAVGVNGAWDIPDSWRVSREPAT